MSRRGVVLASATATIGAAVGVGYALQRRAANGWRADAEDLVSAGFDLPSDLVHHEVPVSDGGAIHAVERGSGPAIVLLHGVTLGVGVWVHQLAALGATHRVVAIDQRGHGSSVAGTDGYSFERMGEDVVEVLAALEVTDAVLVGHSMGGMIALTLAVAGHPGLGRHVGALVLLATAAGPLLPSPLVRLAAVGVLGGAGRGLRFSERRGRGLIPQRDVATWMSRSNFGLRPDPAAVEYARRLITAMSPTAMAGLLGPLFSYDVHDDLSTVDVPTRVVVGDRDLLTPPRMAAVLADGIPGASLTVLEGCGHLLMLEQPTAVDEVLVAASSSAATPAAADG